MVIILQILETASLNEEIRINLSDKKKIKDLFLAVINSIEIKKNMTLVSSLVQFISNLCYGQGRLKQMLAKEDKGEFLRTLKNILKEISESEQKNKTEQADTSLLKGSIYNFIGNLCIEKTLRLSVASNTEFILTQIVDDFKQDLEAKKFDMWDMVTKQLAIFINVSIEATA